MPVIMKGGACLTEPTMLFRRNIPSPVALPQHRPAIRVRHARIGATLITDTVRRRQPLGYEEWRQIQCTCPCMQPILITHIE
jgi:hypothetical protein